MPYRKIFKWLATLFVFCFVMWVIYQHHTELMTIFQRLALPSLGLVLLFQITILALGGMAFNLLCIALDYHVHWRDWLGLSYVASFLNQLLPYRPGLAFRFIYLKRYYLFKTSDFIGITFFIFIILAGAALTLALISTIMGNLPKQLNGNLLPAIGIFTLFLSALALIKWFAKSKGTPLKGTHALTKIMHHPILILISTISTISALLFGGLAFYTIFIDIDLALPFLHCVFLISLFSISMLIPITPGNIGVTESIIGAMTQMLYGDFTQGFAAVALYRLGQFTVSLCIGGPLLGYFVICNKIS